MSHLKVIVNPKDELAWNRVLMLIEGIGPKTAEKILKQLKENIPDIRIDSDFENSTVQSKVANSEILKIPYTIVIGDKEEKNGTLAVRERGQKPKFGIKINDFIKELKEKIEKRT